MSVKECLIRIPPVVFVIYYRIVSKRSSIIGVKRYRFTVVLIMLKGREHMFSWGCERSRWGVYEIQMAWGCPLVPGY